MAIRKIREDGDDVLRKISKNVDVIDNRIITLIKDMTDTLYDAQGVGLAAPQVGVLKRVVVIDVGGGLFELINPKIIEASGEEIDIEGCLSIPGLIGEVSRPQRVVVEAQDPSGEKITINADGLLARALCHEIDHLDGILYKDKAIRFIDPSELEEE